MASLNTLRTRGGVIVSIVIGIALLAFILSDSTIIDFISGGSSARDPKIGVINGKNVRYTEFMNERSDIEAINRYMYGTASSGDDYENISNQAWETLVMKNSFLPGFEKLGLTVSETEQVDMTTGIYLSPVITGTFVNPATGMFDPAILKEFIDNLEREKRYESGVIWNYLKEQMNTHRSVTKFTDLVAKGMFINDLEVNYGLDYENRVSDISVVGLRYNTIPDSTVLVTKGEIRDYYNNNKNLFKQNASRDIDYVVFEITPSENDFAKAEERAQELASAFEAAENPLQYARLNSPDDRTEAVFQREDRISENIYQALFTEGHAIYGPVLENDTYTIVRIGEVRTMPDSVKVSHILMRSEDKSIADSLLNVLRRGGSFAEIAREYSLDPSTTANSGDMGTFPPENLEVNAPEFFNAILSTNAGDLALVEAPYGIHIVKVHSKTGSVRKVKLATIKYVVKASSATQSTVLSQAQQFYAQANGSTENFRKAVNEFSLNKRMAHIGNTDRNVSGLDNSLEVVRWAFNNKKGSISEPISVGMDYYLVANVTDVRDNGTSTLEQASSGIHTKLVKEKKAELLAQRLQGTSLQQIAENNATEVTDIERVGFNESYLHGIGVEPRLIGAATAQNSTNAISAPVVGNTGVYVFEVSAIETVDNIDEREERVKLEAGITSYLEQRLTQALIEESNIIDERVKYL